MAATAQTTVTDYKPGITPEGITYYLPRTELVITITATKTEYIPGDFSAYASRFLRLKDVTTEARTEWKLNDISMQVRGIPDKNKLYTIQLKPKTVAPLVGMTPSGILCAINANADTKEADTPLPQPIVKTSKLNPRDFLTEEILSAGSNAKMAELTAAEIYDIRESRTLLSKGEADFMPKDGEQLKLMIQNLQTQEEALLQLFKGKTIETTQSFRLTYTPEQETDREILFRFSKVLGIVEKNNLAGSPVYIRIADQKTLPDIAAEATAKKKKEVNDVRYTLPSEVAVTVFTPQKELLKKTIPMGQFGRVEHLGGDLFNKMSNTRVFLDPTNGGIRKIEAPTPQ